MKILNFGSLNFDYVYKVKSIVKPGETIDSDEMQVFCGGKGLNQSIALARAGANVYHGGAVGEDGELLINTCKANNVNIENIVTLNKKSGHTIIQVDDNGENSIVLFGGANKKITKEIIDSTLKKFENGDILLLQNEINLIDYIIEEASNKGMKIILNPSPYNETLKFIDLSRISMFILNEIEGKQITGETDAKSILNKITEMYNESQVVLTLGEQGVLYKDKSEVCSQKAYKVDTVDTTAAGDTFTGYLIACLIKNYSINKCLEIASKAAAIAVSKFGATDSIPYLSEVLNTKF